MQQTSEQRRRQSNAERQRRKRAKAGCMTRDEYLATSLSRTKPWEALGIKRRAWERRRNKIAKTDARGDDHAG